MARRLRLKLLQPPLSVVRLPADAVIPPHILDTGFFSVTRTDEELSVLCETTFATGLPHVEPGWRALKVQGPLDFGEVGILADLSAVLAERKISIFAVSTFDTDYLMVKEAHVQTAVEALREAGHEVVG